LAHIRANYIVLAADI